MSPSPTHEDEPSGIEISRWVLPPFWTVGFLLVFYVLPWGISFLSERHGWIDGGPGLVNLVSLILVLVGTAGFVWTASLHFVECSESVEVEWTPRYLLLRGPYRFSRNPMYLAEQTIWLGWALFFGSVALLVLLLLMWGVQNQLVRREELTLEGRFGEAYLRYKSAVPRWIGRTRTPSTSDP